MAATALGAGRAVAEDVIDPAVGVELVKKCGDRVEEGEVLARIHHNSDLGPVADKIRYSYTITDTYDGEGELVLDRISS